MSTSQRQCACSQIPVHPGRKKIKKKTIAVLEKPPYSPDLAACDFFLCSNLNGILKGREDHQEVRNNRS